MKRVLNLDSLISFILIGLVTCLVDAQGKGPKVNPGIWVRPGYEFQML